MKILTEQEAKLIMSMACTTQMLLQYQGVEDMKYQLSALKDWIRRYEESLG